MSATTGHAASRRMRGNIRWNLVGSVFAAAAQWLQLVIVARIGGATAAGEFAYALALCQPVMALASLNIRALQASDVRGEYRFREYRRLRLVMTGAALAAVAILAWQRADTGAWAVLAAVAAMRAADLITDVYYGQWQRHERMHAIGANTALTGLLSVGFMTAGSRFGGGLAHAAAGGAAGAWLGVVVIHVWTRRDSVLGPTLTLDAAPVGWGRVMRLGVAAVPLGAIILLSSLQHNVPRYFVHEHGGDALLGLFAAANNLTSAGTILVSAVGSAAIPRLSALWQAGDVVAFGRFTRRAVVLGASIGLAGAFVSWLVGSDVLAVVYRPDFASGAPMLVVLSVYAGTQAMGSFLGYALTSARVITIQPFLLAGTLGALAASCAVLVPSSGGVGAAWGLVLAGSLQVVGSVFVLRRSEKRRAMQDPLSETAAASPAPAASSIGRTSAE
jgi:O-antigen/teichoic acid export membrane protein